MSAPDNTFDPVHGTVTDYGGGRVTIWCDSETMSYPSGRVVITAEQSSAIRSDLQIDAGFDDDRRGFRMWAITQAVLLEGEHASLNTIESAADRFLAYIERTP